MGAGIQAKSHLEAMLAARNIKQVRVWSRNGDHAKSFANNQSKRYNIAIEAIGDAQQSVEGADIICTTTSSPEPILKGDWLQPGVHINAVGSSVAFTRELDTAAMVKSKLFVDRRESTVNEAGDFLFPKKEGVISDDHIVGEIGDILLGKLKGRQTHHEVTVFKSLGLA